MENPLEVLSCCNEVQANSSFGRLDAQGGGPSIVGERENEKDIEVFAADKFSWYTYLIDWLILRL